ncbi:putative splicing factor 3A subunit 1 [Bidens hawaiensis]|uniref:putative splicing factor 3A subunit 1 n=1 Tax=Bidens hawaiensis TaxID=980011 RepID=UPI00404A9F27
MANSASASVATDTQTTHPPRSIRSVLEKTASFVAKRGPTSEKYISVSNAGNPPFHFLNVSDPYHAYYQHQLSEFRAQNQTLSDAQNQTENQTLPEVNEPPMGILKSYKSPKERLAEAKINQTNAFVFSPATRKFVPVNEMPEHLGSFLTDSNCEEAKEGVPAKIREIILSKKDVEVSGVTVKLARTRPDILRTTGEIEKKNDEQQPPLPPGSQFTSLAPPHPLPEEPEPKRQKLDNSLLVPEDQFLDQHPGPVCISVSVPNADEGNLKGQMLELIVESLSESIGGLKEEKIAREIQQTNRD